MRKCPPIFCLGRGHLRPSTSAYAWGTQLWFEHLGDIFLYIDPHFETHLEGSDGVVDIFQRIWWNLFKESEKALSVRLKRVQLFFHHFVGEMFNDQDDSNSCGSVLLVDARQIFEVSENEVSLVALFSPVPFTFVNEIRVYYTSSYIVH